LPIHTKPERPPHHYISIYTLQFFILCCTCCIHASGQGGKSEFLIEGRLEGNVVSKLTIAQLDDSFNPVSHSDIQLVNGKFTVRGKAEHPRLFYFYSPDITWQQKIIVLVYPGETNVHINTADWSKYQVSGSPGTKAYFNFSKEYEQAHSLFTKSNETIKFPKIVWDTVDGKKNAKITETYNCYLLKTDTVEESAIASHSLLGKVTDYGTVTIENKEKRATGDYIFRHYGDSTEVHMNKVVYNHLELNKNTEVGAIIAFQHFVTHHFTHDADSAYNILSSNAQNTFYGKSLKNYIELHRFQKKIDFSFMDITGKQVRLSSLKSQFILVHFWAAWCENCRPQNKELAALYNRTGRDQLEFVNISYDQTRTGWEAAIKTDSLPGYHTSELRGFDNAIGRMFNVRELPSAFLLDNKGNVLLINPDFVSYIENKIHSKQ